MTAQIITNIPAVVLSRLPGASTPTCSNRQCPAYDLVYDELRRHGVDEVYYVSVNDAFVMHQWARSLGIRNVKLIPDGNGQFTRRMGMLVNKEHLGFGYRSWHYAMVVNDAIVEKWFEEPGINDTGADDDPYGETDPERGSPIWRRRPTGGSCVALPDRVRQFVLRMKLVGTPYRCPCKGASEAKREGAEHERRELQKKAAATPQRCTFRCVISSLTGKSGAAPNACLRSWLHR